ncbi:nucleotidyltransferase domain protein [Clostridium homopropionicum DSM 5847]|uniref:Nucleotidyltransferase domain protein n=1 Tax=Clostridium homopropionicum DSM 5847 TaxID=1121318 RepID=A0A0L6ZEB5_9CLOT|nr:nucleotidyltransferase domain-containing protein [Clostridium homopropionicum]KOA21324.1 nucleotidyltransferase domain protein [Clostridium homopropionicum DSM 5847]SFG95793.1 Predicted nucleotidyltransferase [Clostridium homopropionicum]
MELDKLEMKLIKFIDDISIKYKIKFAYLFGSRARGDNKNNSDIDIALFFEKDYDPMEETFIRGNIAEDGMTFFNMPFDVISLNNAPLLLKYQIVKEGIVLKDNYERSTFESLVLREYFDFKYYSDIYDEAIINSIKAGDYFWRG